MGRYIIRRLIYLVVVLLAVSMITFGLMHAVPGGPFTREKTLPDNIIANLNKYYRLDEPLWKQYVRYISDVTLPRFSTQNPSTSFRDNYLVNIQVGKVWFQWMNFGPSYRARTRTVNDIFRENLPISSQLGVMSLAIALAIGLPLGIIAALKQNTLFDYASMGIAILGISMPVIVLGPLLVWIFAVTLRWLPPTGWGAKPPFVLGLFPSTLNWEFFRFAIMPSLGLGMAGSAVIARLTRASLLQTIREDYIRTARAKGLREGLVTFRHALKNSLIPVVTIIGPMFAGLVTGTFVTELIFGIPGMGRYFVSSIFTRDYPVIMGTILLYAIILVIANLFVDVAYAFLDPRIRYE